MKRFVSLLLALSLILSASLSLGESAPLNEEELEILEAEARTGDQPHLEDPEDDEPDPESVPMAELTDPDKEDVDPDDLPDEDELEEVTVDSRVLQYGDEGADVMELQIRLTDLKYYTGNLSGRYREGTRAAVKNFQSDFNLEQTGIADPETQNLIFSTRYRPLRVGSEGDDVKNLQKRLTELGYYKGKISGNYLSGTKSGISHFQEKNGLPATGNADVQTQRALFAATAVGKNDTPDTAAAPTPVPDLAGYLVDDADTAANNGVVMPENYVEFTKTLKSGSNGQRVKELQTRMTELGYYEGPISGNFARQTLRAVKAIQVQNGMKETGQVDEATWNVIFNDRGIVMPGATPKPTPEPTPVPFAMTVDVTNQVTTVYARDEQGQYTVPVRRMMCSTGTKANPSDVGDWVLNGRHARWCVFPTWGNSYARYWTRINASIAFHSVIYTAVSLDAMKTSSYKALGSRASHGCVRLTVEDAKWVYDNIGEGTVVSIREDLPADQELRDALKLPPLKKGTSIPVETPVPTPEPDYDPAAEPELPKRVLRKNSEGPEVYWVQRRLTDLGFYSGYVGGKILNGTVKAIKDFQRANKIYPSGEVDQRTLDALVEVQPTPTVTPEATPTPVPAETPTAAPTETPAPTAEPAETT